MRRATSFNILSALTLAASLASSAVWSANDLRPNEVDKMSSMGQRAAAEVARIRQEAATSAAARTAVTNLASEADATTGRETCLNQPRCPGGLRESAPGGQAELSIAVDETGQHIVIGFNDTRGFTLNPISVSGFMYSEDGGDTFIDGGQLPSPGNQSIGATLLPQVFGDPEVKYLGNCVFIYSSIVVFKATDAAVVQSMGVHRSTDCGKTWQGPFEVTAASNPNGGVDANGAPLDAADKEFMDVDPETGRVIMSWSNFTPFAPGGVEIRTTFSDNLKTGAPPTWSAGAIVAATAADGQASIPRFAASSSNAYVAWRRFPFPGTFFGFGNNVAFARSLDNGATWQAPIETSPEFFTMDQVLGNDRVNTSPSLAVDNSHGPRRGTIYLTYANNDGRDGADIIFQRSTNNGASFSAPLRLNAAPAADRAQWFPWVTVDSFTGRVHVFYYDQGIDDTGDLSEVSYVYSDNGGQRWSAPVPLSMRPFRAGWGNDTGQPNLGDYNQAVSQHGELFAAFAVTARPPRGYVDGQPTSASMTVPDIDFRRISQFRFTDVNSLPLSINVNAVSFTDSGGNGRIDPGETVRLRLPLENYTLNPRTKSSAQNVTALLVSTTPGVQVIQPIGLYGRIGSGQTITNFLDYRLRIGAGFDPGNLIELKLVATGRFGDRHITAAELRHTLFSGTPEETTLLTENFNGVAPGALPAGWTAAHGGGTNTVPWTTSNSFCSNGTNAAFHQDAEDNPGGDPTRFERLFSPNFAVPANSDYVTIEFDVCTDTEDDPNFNVQAYDGLLLRVFDATPGNFPRSVLVEAYADEFTTGPIKHYPKHLPRSRNPAYFQDMSVWAGDSGGQRRVRLTLPGMAGTIAQLRFEYTQDGIGTCLDVGSGPVCGVSVDNITIKSVRAVAQP